MVLSNSGSQRLIIFHFEIINYTLMIRGFSEKIMIGIRSLFYSFSKSIFKFTCNSFVENLINYSLFIDIRTWISIQCILFIFCWKWTSQVNIRRMVTLIEVLQLSSHIRKFEKSRLGLIEPPVLWETISLCFNSKIKGRVISIRMNRLILYRFGKLRFGNGLFNA